jgi:hypothetical protein
MPAQIAILAMVVGGFALAGHGWTALRWGLGALLVVAGVWPFLAAALCGWEYSRMPQDKAEEERGSLLWGLGQLAIYAAVFVGIVVAAARRDLTEIATAVGVGVLSVGVLALLGFTAGRIRRPPP